MWDKIRDTYMVPFSDSSMSTVNVRSTRLTIDTTTRVTMVNKIE